jgi:hypothetical protein
VPNTGCLSWASAHARFEPGYGLAGSRDVADHLVLAFDEALLVPGEIVRTAIYGRIERSYQIRREEIPEKLETFHQALQDLLGAGGKVMEKLIAKSLYRRLKLSFTEHDGWTLVDYVNHAKRSEANGSREG